VNPVVGEGSGSDPRATTLEVRLGAWEFMKGIAVSLALLLLGGSGLWIMGNPLLRFAGIVVGVGLGLAALAATIAKVASGPMLRMDSRGIRHAVLGAVRWQDVGGIAFEIPTHTRGSNGPFLALGLVPGAEIVGAGWLPSALNPRGSYRFSMGGLDHSPAQILQHAIALRDEVQPPRLKTWTPGMSPELLAAAMEEARALDRVETPGRPGLPDRDLTEATRLHRELASSALALKRARERDDAKLGERLRFWTWASLILSIAVFLLRVLSHYLPRHG
jgi:hypothetical protein